MFENIPDEDVLDLIAFDQLLPRSAIYLSKGIVWYTTADGALKTACAKGTPYWDEMQAGVYTNQLVLRYRGKFL